MTTQPAETLTPKQRLAIGVAFVFGAVLTLFVAFSMIQNGPGSSTFWSLHQAQTPPNWVPATSLAPLSEAWKPLLTTHKLSLFPLDGATVVGGAPVQDSQWRYIRWSRDNKRVSMFLKPTSHTEQPQWACKPVGGVRGTMCQKTSRGWHVALISEAPASP